MLITSSIIMFIGITTAILDGYFPYNMPIDRDYSKRINEIKAVQGVRLALIFLLAIIYFL
jgi:hypothetical protein